MGSATDSRRPWTFAALASVATLGLLGTVLLGAPGESAALRAIGSVALVLSAVFIFPPFFVLKRHGRPESGHSFFDTTRFVDRGIYRIVRHPQYLGYILLVAGFALRSQELPALILGTAAIVLFNLQTLREERFLVETFGAEYEAYRDAVPRFNFVSGLYRYWARQARRRS